MKLSLLVCVVALTGCGTAQQWSDTINNHQRNYGTAPLITNPYNPALDPKNFRDNYKPGSYTTRDNGTANFLINTPQGIQHVTCKNLNGNHAYCF